MKLLTVVGALAAAVLALRRAGSIDLWSGDGERRVSLPALLPADRALVAQVHVLSTEPP